MTTSNPAPSHEDALKKIESALNEGGERSKALAAKVDAFERRIEAFDEALKNRGVDRRDESRKIGMGAVVRGLLLGGLDEPSAWKGADFERQVGLAGREAIRSLPDSERARVSNVTTAGQGGYIVPPAYQPEYIDLLTAQTVLRQAGAMDVTGITGSPFQIPRLTAGTTAAYINETGTAISDSTPTWDQPSGTPKLLTGAVKITRRLAALSNPAIEAVVNRRLATDLGLKQDETGIRGSGVSPIPTGIRNASGVTVTNLAGVPDIDDLYDMLYRLESANANTQAGRVAWLMHPRTWNTLRKLREGAGTGQYLIQPDPTSASRFSMLGFPVFRTTQIPINLGVGTNESEVYLGDFSDLWHLWWGTLGIEVSNVAGDAFLNHQVWVKAFLEDDWMVARPASFQVLAQVQA